MDIIKLLPEYLDLGVDANELVAITQAALAKRIRDLKLAIAEAVVQARACTLLDNLEGSHQALQRARQLQKEYHHFFAEWRRLNSTSGAAGDGAGGLASSLEEGNRGG
jgi:hypothetical protein